jgi:hypothetical protein
MALFRSSPPPTLDELALRHGTDKSSRQNALTEKYAPFLEPRRGEALTLLEIGVDRGASLRLWHDYFPRARVAGIDVRPECPRLEELAPRVSVHIADQARPEELLAVGTQLAAETGGLDVVIDDGTHLCAHQIVAFKTLYPLLRPGGLYFVEDVTTSYRDQPYGGGLGRPDTLLRFAMDLVPFIPMSMGSVPAREPWEREIDFVQVSGYGGLVVVGRLSAARLARIQGHDPA